MSANSISAIVSRLEALGTLAAVEQPSRINPLERTAYPCATVYPGNEVVTSIGQTLSSTTRLTRRYHILLTTDSASSLEDSRDAIVRQLSGYVPEAGMTPMAYVEGSLEQLNGSLMQYVMQFETTVCYG